MPSGDARISTGPTPAEMSPAATHEVTCRCGTTVEARCVDSINVERSPHMRDMILARQLHVFRCKACDSSIVIDKPLLYLDLARRELYGVHPIDSRADERAHGEELVATWSVALGDRASATARAMLDGDGFHVRLCYGLEELREKIVAHAAGLHDLALEATKVVTHAELAAELAPLGVVALRFEGLTSEGKLVLFAERATDPPSLLDIGLVVEQSRYDELDRLPWQELLARFPKLASGPHVSALRMVA